MKSELIGLGLWAMRYSTLAMLKNLPLDPLLDVNRNVLRGLLDQGGTSDAATSAFPATKLAV